jgi:hypothetical protein
VIVLTKVILDFSEPWLAQARRAHGIVNMIRMQQKQPRLSFENWLKLVLTLSLAQTLAEVESTGLPPVDVQDDSIRKPGKTKPE